MDIPMATVSPIKVDESTDQMITDAAHFLGRTKKDIVDVAVRDYVDAHRAEINAAIKASFKRLDGTRASVVSEITGYSRAELDDLGGVPEN
jgi:predicted transcriptional regulator